MSASGALETARPPDPEENHRQADEDGRPLDPLDSAEPAQPPPSSSSFEAFDHGTTPRSATMDRALAAVLFFPPSHDRQIRLSRARALPARAQRRQMNRRSPRSTAMVAAPGSATT